MTGQAGLERGYRRLLAWYPQAFRRENGQEILAVLMACAPDGQRRPGLAESADLISSGLRMRLRLRVPQSAPTVRAAVRLMHAGAAISAVYLIISLAIIIGGNKAGHATLNGHRLTAVQASHLYPLIITVAIASGLVVIAPWLWMARANGQGRNWARTLSTVLFGLATLELISVLPQSVISVGLTGLGLTFWAPTWLVGLAAVWLLWRPASSAFFKPHGSTQAGHSAQPMPRTRSSSPWTPRQL
jgi:hypothetical protein